MKRFAVILKRLFIVYMFLCINYGILLLMIDTTGGNITIIFIDVFIIWSLSIPVVLLSHLGYIICKDIK